MGTSQRQFSIFILTTTFLVAMSSAAFGQAPQPEKKPKPVVRTSPIETVRRYLQKLGSQIDESRSKGNILVTPYKDEKRGKVDIVIAYDPKKSLIGFYVYDFGNIKQAPDASALRTYLLSANDQLAIGAFFIDGENDIGYKYLTPSEQLSLPTFQSIYMAMATVALERRPEIWKLLGKTESESSGAQQS